MSEKNLRNVVAENPLLILFLGACPAMGATATVLGAAGMGAAVLVVMLLSGIVMAALNKVIPASGRVPAYILIITGFVSIVQMLMNAFLPDVYKMLGIYITISVLRSVLEPRLVGLQLGLDPLVTLAALYAGYKLWGIAGMILAPLLTVTAMQLLPQRDG